MKTEVLLLGVASVFIALVVVDMSKRWNQALMLGCLKFAEHDRQIVALANEVQKLLVQAEPVEKISMGFQAQAVL